jgi:hypothetical protein
VERKSKNFHFQEMDWLISFPSTDNEGRKYLYYSVEFTNRKKKQGRAQIRLMEIVDSADFECFPHTVGYFKGAIEEKKNDSGFAYLEIRIIRSLEDFWKFLNDLNL